MVVVLGGGVGWGGENGVQKQPYPDSGLGARGVTIRVSKNAHFVCEIGCKFDAFLHTFLRISAH